ncbi:MAG: class I SAM-dependent methyltransferase [Mangrovicoccus sp.]|nr:class I SAM-dependent methyltransferase [Mangrovicoccus sp.]
MWSPQDLIRLHDAVPATYEAKAAAWDRARSRALVERDWIARTVAGLAPGAPVLDLGCGSGAPISDHLIDRGFRVTGIDVAPAMLAMARARHPGADWVLADMRHAPLPGGQGAIIGWDSVFHLTGAEQRALLPRLVAALAPGGHLLVTVGATESEAVGQVDGSPVYHASLSPETYERLCRDAGCEPASVTLRDAQVGRSVLLARRAG